MTALPHQLYVALRRRVRQVVTRSPLFDRTLGTLLRQIESRLGLANWTGADNVIEHDGFRIHHAQGDAGVVSSLRLNADYEPETTEVLLAMLKPGDCFIDLGAHIGFFSLLAARAVGEEGHVFAFEPVETSASLLQRNLTENGFSETSTVVQKATGDTVGTVRFAIHEHSSVSNKMVAAAGSDEGLTVDVAMTTLDAFLEAKGNPSVRLVKMDVEGAELATMRGMKETCANNPDISVIFELHHANLQNTNIEAAALFRELQALGFNRFFRLHRTKTEIRFPEDLEENLRLAEEFNFNVVAER